MRLCVGAADAKVWYVCLRNAYVGRAGADQFAASFNEKLVLSNGLSISPLKPTTETRSLRESVLAIDNDKDLNDYLSGQHAKLPPRTGPPKYERNPVRSPPCSGCS